MTFHPDSIWFLLLLPLAALAWWRSWSLRRRSTLAFPSLALLAPAGRGWFARVRGVLPLLRALTITLLVVCLARPIRADQQSRVFVEGIAIQMVVDRSSSMMAHDFSIGGRSVDRLEAVKRVAEKFISGDDSLGGRPDDLIGLISFARYADSLAPPTLDHAFLIDGLRQMRISRPGTDEDGTAIGDALALAVEHLRDVDQHDDPAGHYRIRSRVIILLTDGENTAGDLEPMVAARLAASQNIRVYTIGAGTNGVAPYPVEIFGQRTFQNVPVTIDEETLTAVADATGGKYFRATDSRSLEEIYRQIDELEKTRTQERRYLSYQDYALQPMPLWGVEIPPVALIVLALLALESLLAFTRLQVGP